MNIPHELASEHWITEVDTKNATAISFKFKTKLHSEKTAFQCIDIYESEHFGHMMVVDGFIRMTQKDHFIIHEMLTHPALFTHAKPQNIAIIGGGDCGILQQILQHGCVKTVIQVEIDERITALSKRYFPEICTNNADPRATLLSHDGLKWLKEARAESLDILILDTTDPVSTVEGWMDKSFYQNAFLKLRSGAILVQHSESPFYNAQSVIAPMQKMMLDAGFSEAKTFLFPLPSYPSGWCSATLAGKNISLTQFRKTNVLEKTFATQYYNTRTHKAAMAIPDFLQLLIR
jgi:spermidine synthase